MEHIFQERHKIYDNGNGFIGLIGTERPLVVWGDTTDSNGIPSNNNCVALDQVLFDLPDTIQNQMLFDLLSWDERMAILLTIKYGISSITPLITIIIFMLILNIFLR